MARARQAVLLPLAHAELGWVTQDMVIEILQDEEAHRRLFEGFLREYEAERMA